MGVETPSSSTLELIARKAGVSQSTVSRMLNGQIKGSWRRSAARMEQVRQLASELGYRVNASARATRTGKSGCVAMVLSDEAVARSNLPGWVLRGINGVLSQHNYHLTLAHMSDADLSDPQTMPKVLREYMCDGVLINYHEAYPTALIDLVRQHRIPAVWINAKLDTDCAYPDDFAAGRDLTRHLLERGHRSIGYFDLGHSLDQPTVHYSAIDRLKGYEAAMQAAGLSPHLLIGQSDTASRDARIRAWLASENRPQAIISYGPPTQLMLIAAEMGIGIGRDLTVATFSDHRVDEFGTPLPTMIVPQGDLGRAAANMLMEKLKDPAEPLAAQAVPFSCSFDEKGS
jgi:LacI family transcriptional regulator